MAEEKKVTVSSKDFRVVFANGFRLRIGDNDGAITFLIETDDVKGQLYHLDEVQVCMTPRTMKLLNTVLAIGISEMEKVLGPIPMPLEKVAELEKSMKLESAPQK